MFLLIFSLYRAFGIKYLSLIEAHKQLNTSQYSCPLLLSVLINANILLECARGNFSCLSVYAVFLIASKFSFVLVAVAVGTNLMADGKLICKVKALASLWGLL